MMQTRAEGFIGDDLIYIEGVEKEKSYLLHFFTVGCMDYFFTLFPSLNPQKCKLENY
jgi:hypothetical protein